MQRVSLVLLIATATLAGCLSPDPEDPEDPVQETGMGFGSLSGLPEDPGPRDLTEAPLWAVGEQWTYRLEAPPFNEETEVTIVVAGADGDHYYVAQPLDDVQILPYIMHIPGIGEVSREDLSWDAHDEPWKLLDFPLEEGRSWQGVYWGGAPMELEVTSVSGTEATIELTGEGSSATITYDAEVGNLVSYEESNDDGLVGLKLELLEHGTGFTGDVRLAYGQDLLICHGTASVALGVVDCALGDPSTPEGTFEIPEGYDQASYAIVINTGSAQGQNIGGTYRVRVVDPHGNEQESTLTGLAGTGMMSLGTRDDPTGVWEYEAVAGGPGFAIVEGITHQTLDIRLPDGCALSTDEDLDVVPCEGPSGS